MSRRSADATLLMLALVIGVPIWFIGQLHEALGPGLFWSLLVLALIGAVVWYSKRESAKPPSLVAPRGRPVASGVGSMEDIENAINAGDWNQARAWLQKIAYGMVGPEVSATDKATFKAFMTLFAARDPGYQAAMAVILPEVRRQPGLRQADLTRDLPAAQLEMARYALYFAHELAQIVRVKKGNSYLLYLPGDVPPAVPELAKPKVRRKKAIDPPPAKP